MEILFSFLTALVLLFGVRFVYMANAVLGGRYRKSATKLLSPEEVPAAYFSLFTGTEGALVAEGFVHSHYMHVENMERSGPADIWYKVLYHPAEATYALLCASKMPEPAQPVYLEFTTFFNDGTELKTFNNIVHQFLGKAACWEVQDPYVSTMAEVWRVHKRRLLEIGSEGRKWPLALAPQAMADRMQKGYADILEQGVVKGYFRPDTEAGIYRLTVRGAVRIAYSMTFRRGKSETLTKNIRKKKSWVSAEAAEGLPTIVEVDAYHRMTGFLQNSQVADSDKLRMLVLQLVLFVGSFLILLGPEYAVALFVVMVLHELGHALAAYYFGMRNLNIMFLPFAGALMTGTVKKPLEPWQGAVVALMGPLPGLIIGYTYFSMGNNNAFTWMFIYINLFNLLPVMPLDGGQIVNSVLSGRFYGLRVLFYGASVLAALVGAVYLKSVALFIVGGVMAYVTLQSVAYRKSVKKHRAKFTGRDLGDQDEGEVLGEIFTDMRLATYASYGFAQKYNMAKLMRDTLMQKPMGRAAVLFWLTAYSMVLALSIYPIVARYAPARAEASKGKSGSSMSFARAVGSGIKLQYTVPELGYSHKYEISPADKDSKCAYIGLSEYRTEHWDIINSPLPEDSPAILDYAEPYETCIHKSGTERIEGKGGNVYYEYTYYWWPARPDAQRWYFEPKATMREHVLAHGEVVEMRDFDGYCYFYDKQTGYLILFGYRDADTGEFTVIEHIVSVNNQSASNIILLLPEIMVRLPLAPDQKLSPALLVYSKKVKS